MLFFPVPNVFFCLPFSSSVSQKNIAEAQDYFKRKVDYLKDNTEKVHATITEKRKLRDAVEVQFPFSSKVNGRSSQT